MSTKTVFTTGEAAKICKVSQQTIIRCFDNGTLKGFRVPGSRFRRIPRDQLYSFMRDNGIPTDALESGKRKLLIVDDDEELVELLVDTFTRDGRFEAQLGVVVLGKARELDAMSGEQRLVCGDNRTSGFESRAHRRVGRPVLPAHQFDEQVDIGRFRQRDRIVEPFDRRCVDPAVA